MSEDFPALAGFRSGSLVAGYRLEAQVGAGGMAVVFRARDERLGRLAALKILAAGLAADDGFRRRFIAESRAAAAVDDPHIIPVYEAGESGGVLFIAMRFVAGGDLRAVLYREGPLPPTRATGFVSSVASALDAAHRAGLVHRDVKPANVLVDASPGRPDHVYLSDFGVSKGAVSSMSLTGTGHFLGTPDYSAPEQIQGLVVDGRTDQYALACVAWQLLTGTVPFERDQGMAVLLAHLNEPPPLLSSRRPGLPATADHVLARAMAKAPEQRYGSCTDFADALRDALGQAPYTLPVPAAAPGHPETEIASAPAFPGPAEIPELDTLTADAPSPLNAAVVTADQRVRPRPTGEAAVPAGRQRRRLLLVGLACALAAAAVAIPLALDTPGTQHALNPSTSHTSSPATTAATTPAAPSPSSGQLTGSVANPSGHFIFPVAFGPGGTVAAGGNGGSVYLWNAATRRLTATLTAQGAEGVRAVAFGPGSTVAAGGNGGSVYLWDTATGQLTATLTAQGSQGVTSVAFGPGGTLAVGDANSKIYLWATATRRLTATLADSGGQGVTSVAFGPGGTLAASDSNGRVTLWDTATGQLRATLTDPNTDGVRALAFAPTGTTVAAADGGNIYLWATATGQLTATLTDPNSQGVYAVAFAPAGTTLAAGDGNNVFLWDTATGQLTATLTDPDSQGVFSVAFAPTGFMLAAGDDNSRTYLWHLTS